MLMATITKRKNKDGSTSYRVEVRLKGFPTERATFARWRKNNQLTDGWPLLLSNSSYALIG